jgi:hypothetical protein
MTVGPQFVMYRGLHVDPIRAGGVLFAAVIQISSKRRSIVVGCQNMGLQITFRLSDFRRQR